ncbi:MAG: hypothetical protein QOD41_1683 [Cryptosporangiaceae bacterium]|nr:hypothetical protein [Cryptosporangiaceae bacterium]
MSALRRSDWIMAGWCALLTGAILAPALRPGYILAYDMVATPRPPLDWRSMGLGDALPRAVPQDAVVAVVALAIRGDLVQKAALVAVVFAAALGAARLVPAGRLVPAARLGPPLVAATVYAWSAYLGERLFIGHWGLLAAYAALPWLVRAAFAVRAGERGAAWRVVACGAPAFLTPSGGVIALGTAVALLATVRRGWAALGGLALLTAPWIVAGLLGPAPGRSDPAGVAAFAPRAENWSGTIGALLTLGGVWNRGAMPASRAGWLAPILGIAVLALAAAGATSMRRAWPAGSLTALATAAAVGLGLAAAGALPGSRRIVALAVESVPGAGLLRDGQKLIAPFALLVAVAAAAGAHRIASWLDGRGERLAATAVLVTAVLLPIAALPDLAGLPGLGARRLTAVHYPPEWDRVAALTARSPGELVTLPFGAFRAYPWNGGRTALDPADRYFAVPVVVDDELVVGGQGAAKVRGESPRAATIRAALAGGRPLAAEGVRWALVERDQPGEVPPQALAGMRQVYQGGSLALYENPAAPDPPLPAPWRRLALLAAYLLALATVVTSVIVNRVHVRVRKSRTDW